MVRLTNKVVQQLPVSSQAEPHDFSFVRVQLESPGVDRGTKVNKVFKTDLKSWCYGLCVVSIGRQPDVPVPSRLCHVCVSFTYP